MGTGNVDWFCLDGMHDIDCIYGKYACGPGNLALCWRLQLEEHHTRTWWKEPQYRLRRLRSRADSRLDHSWYLVRAYFMLSSYVGIEVWVCVAVLSSFNAGQVCAAGSRIFVHAKIYDKFLKAFTEKVKRLQVGDPFAMETYQGPLVSQIQMDVSVDHSPLLTRSRDSYGDTFLFRVACGNFQRVVRYIEEGKKEGATLHLGGERKGSSGYFIQPTVFTDCKPSMKIVREEIFGPVAVMIKFDDEEEVIRMANDTIYGLGAGVFSLNIKRALSVAHRIQAGTVGVNMVNMTHWQAPFGGFKQSGMGRELGEESLR